LLSRNPVRVQQQRMPVSTTVTIEHFSTLVAHVRPSTCGHVHFEGYKKE